MKTAFGLTFAAMILGSVGVWMAQPKLEPDGKTALIWTSDDNPLRQAQIQAFDRSHPDLGLHLDPANGDMEKVIVQSIGGVGPDLFDCRDADQLSAYVKAGVALDVTDALAAKGIDVKRDVWPTMLSMCVLDGRVYGVPTNAAANALWFNKDLFDKAGVGCPSGPWTWDRFIPLAQRMTVRGADGRVKQYGLMFDWYMWKHVLLGFGASEFSADGTRCTLGDDNAIAAIQLMHDLVYKYKVTPSPTEEASMATQGGFGSGTIAEFGSGRAAMALGGRWWLATLRPFPNLRLGVAESPYGTVRAYGAVGRATLVNKNGPHVKQAMEFLEFMAGADYNRLIDRQADGVAAFKKYAYEPEFLRDPAHPDETDNGVWRTATEFALPIDASPFINGSAAATIVEKQIDLVRIDAKSARDAMTDAARQVNDAIRQNLADDPDLKARWDSLRRAQR